MIRSGVTPDVADDILVKRFSGNPKLWGGVLGVLGVAFLLQTAFRFRLPDGALVAVDADRPRIYLLRGYIFKAKTGG